MYKYLPIFIWFLVGTFSYGQGFKKKESLGVTLSLPFLNRYTFFEYSENRSTSKTGVIGIGASLFYQHNRYKYFINWANSTDLNFNSFDKGIRNEIEVELLEGLFYYKTFKKINLIGGINYSIYHYFTSHYNPSYFGLDFNQYNELNKRDNSIGITLGGELPVTNELSIIAFYRPAIYCFDKKSFKQMFSLDFRFDINLWRRK